jgi:hypothetical protein
MVKLALICDVSSNPVPGCKGLWALGFWLFGGIAVLTNIPVEFEAALFHMPIDAIVPLATYLSALLGLPDHVG